MSGLMDLGKSDLGNHKKKTASFSLDSFPVFIFQLTSSASRWCSSPTLQRLKQNTNEKTMKPRFDTGP